MTFNTWEPKLFVMRIITQYTELVIYSYLFAMLICLCMAAWCMFIYTSDTVLCCILQNGFIGKGTMSLVQSKWESVIDKSDDFYSFDGILDGALEKKCNSRLIVSGPLVDVYLKELGGIMFSKLCRGKATGVQSGSPVLILWQVMVNIMIKGYGGSVKAKLKGGSKEKLFTVTINTENCARKIYNLRRCGKNLLSKRKFVTSADGKFVFSGCLKIVVTGVTPIIISYYTKTQKASLSFCIQRYDDQDFALNAPLQSRLNGE